MKLRLALSTAIVTLIICLTIVSIPAYAQKAGNEDAATIDMEILREKIKADKKLIVASNMNLSESESKAFWPVYDEFQNRLMQNNDKLGNLIVEYADNFKSMTDKTAQKLLKELMLLEKERLDLKEKFLPKFQKVLPAVKVARYYQIENKIQAILQYQLAESIPLME